MDLQCVCLALLLLQVLAAEGLQRIDHCQKLPHQKHHYHRHDHQGLDQRKLDDFA